MEYLVLDVFAGRSYQGNPLSVVFTNGKLELSEYENISREFGYSETSFVYYSAEQKALNVRSFTPIGFEVDGAGHNLLGAVCAALLKGLDIFEQQDKANPFVLMKDAPIPLSVAYNAGAPVVRMRQKAAEIKAAVSPEIVAEALGLRAEDLTAQNLLPTIAQTEVAHLMVPVKNAGMLNEIRQDEKKLVEISEEYNFEGFYCFALGENGNPQIAEARFFNPLIGITEDAATGTAAGPLAGFLRANNLIEPDTEYKILQGVKLNQPSLIEVTAKDNGILVGGSSVITMEGKIYL